jgi:hypothetical protein
MNPRHGEVWLVDMGMTAKRGQHDNAINCRLCDRGWRRRRV